MRMPQRYREIALAIGTTLALVGVVLAVANELAVRAAPDVTMVPHTMPVAVRSATATGNVPGGQSLSLTLTLRPRNQAALRQFVQAVSTPRSVLYHQFITPAAFALTFGPDPAQVLRVESFAASNGLRVATVRSGGLFITLSGAVSRVEQAFGVRLATYRGANGKTFFANTGDYSLPSGIAPSVLAVTGLDNAPLRQSHIAGAHPLARGAVVARPRTPANCPQTQGTYGLTPPQLATAYQFPTTVTGAGQSMALVEFDGYLSSDISAYTACFAPGVNVGNVLGTRLVDMTTPFAPGAGAVEDELDIEIALGMAPGLSHLDVYEAPNSNQGLIDMMSAIASDDKDGTVSDSWGSCESDSGFSVAASEEMAFLEMAAQGQGVYVAAGDSAAYDCLGDLGSGPYFHGQTVAADDPATDPYVTAVGGTTLTQNASTGTYISESVWNNSTLSSDAANNGGGGGISQFWASPSWQAEAKATSAATGVADPTGGRVEPDVTANADPQTGYAEYCTAGATCASLSGWFDVGGTSAGAPLWAALAALAGQQAGTRAGLITPALYALYGADTGASSATGIALGGTTYYDYQAQKNGATVSGGSIAFNDITSGDNTFPSNQGFQPGYSAGGGYDAASGLGSMQGKSIASYLAGAIRFTAPRLYMAAQGSNGGLWISGYFMNNGDGNIVPDSPTGSGWVSLGSQQFEGQPAIADNGVTTVALSGATALVYVAGVGTGGTARFGAWNPATMSFGGWATLPGATCKGSPAAAFAQGKLFVSCMTTTGAIVLDELAVSSSTWSGWATIGGGLTAPPTMATDGTNLLIFAQAPVNKSVIDWYTVYTVATGATTQWQSFSTTCEASPALAYAGAADNDFMLSCIANDTSTMWSNTFTVSTGGLSGWAPLGEPSSSVGFHNATAVSVDLADNPTVTFFTGEGTDNATYVTPQTNNTLYDLVSGWQRVSLPGIFSSGSSTDYFGV